MRKTSTGLLDPLRRDNLFRTREKRNLTHLHQVDADGIVDVALAAGHFDLDLFLVDRLVMDHVHIIHTEDLLDVRSAVRTVRLRSAVPAFAVLATVLPRARSVAPRFCRLPVDCFGADSCQGEILSSLEHLGGVARAGPFQDPR